MRVSWKDERGADGGGVQFGPESSLRRRLADDAKHLERRLRGLELIK